eukprot:6176142-Pleurochrysis_carterae.AAC.1
MRAKNKKNKTGTTSGAQADDDDVEETIKLALEMEMQKVEHVEELERVKSECKDAIAAMKAECKRMLKEIRIKHAAETAELQGKIELLEQHLVKAKEEKMVVFVDGFNRGGMKMKEKS